MTEAARNELVEAHVWLADRLARWFWLRTPRHVVLDDLRSHAHLGLLHAAGRFDASHRVPFEAYARYRIIGAIRDGVRSETRISVSTGSRHRYALRPEHVSLEDVDGGALAISNWLPAVEARMDLRTLMRRARKTQAHVRALRIVEACVAGETYAVIAVREHVNPTRIAQLAKFGRKALRAAA